MNGIVGRYLLEDVWECWCVCWAGRGGLVGSGVFGNLTSFVFVFLERIEFLVFVFLFWLILFRVLRCFFSCIGCF